MVWMHSLITAFYLSYFGKDATWNKNIKYILKQKKCNKFWNGPKSKSKIRLTVSRFAVVYSCLIVSCLQRPGHPRPCSVAGRDSSTSLPPWAVSPSSPLRTRSHSSSKQGSLLLFSTTTVSTKDTSPLWFSEEVMKGIILFCLFLCKYVFFCHLSYFLSVYRALCFEGTLKPLKLDNRAALRDENFHLT